MSINTNSIRRTTCVADALGLGRLGDGASGTDPELLRRIYRHCRNEDGKRVLFENDSSFAGKWVNLSVPAAMEIITAFVPLDDGSDLKKARNLARTNMQAVPWNDVLGIESPPIRCLIRIHGKKWGMRFESGEPVLKGRSKVNEQLPPIPTDAEASCAQDGTPAAITESPAAPDTPVTASGAAAALSAAGMPS
jgi:hypothetical protein